VDEVTVRPAEPRDAAGIAGVHTETWQVAYVHVFGPDRLGELSVDERARRWRAILEGARPGSRTLVAERDARIVGFASVGPTRDTDDRAPSGELYGIYSHPDEWGRGTGTKLLSAAVAELQAFGHDAASLWVLDDNPRARAFYEREGWGVDGMRKRGEFLGLLVDEVRYRRALPERT
jgi:GNAT superfamily N-acetyltransferase